MFENINREIPESSLTYFLELLILKNKRHKLENLKLICTTIGHCIREDVDLLIILISRTPVDKMIYFLKLGKGQTETKIYSSQS